MSLVQVGNERERFTDGNRCDLSRPCTTCRERDHPELCSYHPPNKKQNTESQSQGPLRLDQDGGLGMSQSSHSGYVTLARTEFDLLCRKLNGLENSIADLRREIRRNNSHENNGNQESDGSSEGHRVQTHTDLHGLHTKNESVSAVKLPQRLAVLLTTPRVKSSISAAGLSQQCSTQSVKANLLAAQNNLNYRSFSANLSSHSSASTTSPPHIHLLTFGVYRTALYNGPESSRKHCLAISNSSVYSRATVTWATSSTQVSQTWMRWRRT